MGAVAFEPALQAINQQARPYPAHLLPEGGTALCLFSAAFLGWNDAIHFARKQMTATCIDVDQPRLREMEGIYPETWTFHAMDAWDFALEAKRHDDQWDAVSADTFTGQPEIHSLHSLELWCDLATTLVTVTCSKGRDLDKLIPDGWRHHLYPRSSEVDWLVLTRG